MTGGRSPPDVAAFWSHCFQQEEWSSHLAKYLEGIPKNRNFFALHLKNRIALLSIEYVSSKMYWGLIPVAVHTDGADMYTNCEYYVWSVGSLFATGEVGGNTSYKDLIVSRIILFIKKQFDQDLFAKVWDVKYPTCLIPHSWMTSKSVWNLESKANLISYDCWWE